MLLNELLSIVNDLSSKRVIFQGDLLCLEHLWVLPMWKNINLWLLLTVILANGFDYCDNLLQST